MGLTIFFGMVGCDLRKQSHHLKNFELSSKHASSSIEDNLIFVPWCVMIDILLCHNILLIWVAKKLLVREILHFPFFLAEYFCWSNTLDYQCCTIIRIAYKKIGYYKFKFHFQEHMYMNQFKGCGHCKGLYIYFVVLIRVFFL